MEMVLAMLLAFLLTGTQVQRVSRWVAAFMVLVITAIIMITYARF